MRVRIHGGCSCGAWFLVLLEQKIVHILKDSYLKTRGIQRREVHGQGHVDTPKALHHKKALCKNKNDNFEASRRDTATLLCTSETSAEGASLQNGPSPLETLVSGVTSYRYA